MDRRTFLVALTPLAAGCFGGQRSQPNATATATPTETAEPTSTAQPESTATDDPEPSEGAAQHIDDAQDRLTEAVYVYTGGVTDDLLSVTAETETFRARDVLLRLDRVQRAIHAAETEATTESQRTTIDSLDTMQRFLTRATDAQSWLIDGHADLTSAYNQLDDNDLDQAESSIERAETAAEEASGATSTIETELNPSSASVVDAIGEDEYTSKASQLTAEADILGTLSDHAKDIQTGSTLITEARDEGDDGRPDEAASTADQAYELLGDVENQLDDLTRDFPAEAEAFEDVADDLLDLASSRAAEADNVYNQYS